MRIARIVARFMITWCICGGIDGHQRRAQCKAATILIIAGKVERSNRSASSTIGCIYDDFPFRLALMTERESVRTRLGHPAGRAANLARLVKAGLLVGKSSMAS